VARGADTKTVLELLEGRRLEAVVLIDNYRATGLVMRASLYQLLSQAFGREVYLRRPVELLARPEPLIVDVRVPLQEASRLATSRSDECRYDHIIVAKDGEYLGTVSVQRLLEAITDTQVAAARMENPLSGLPGSPAINREVEQRLAAGVPFTALHIDLDNFKAYNDVYGFHRGDLAIRMTADLLSGLVGETCGEDAFLGHVGGDDFVALVPSRSVADFSDKLTQRFDERIRSLYDPGDLERGWIVSAGRSGEPTRFPVMTLTIASASHVEGSVPHQARLLDSLSESKRLKKKEMRARLEPDPRVLTPAGNSG
jgi:GGDEF domain-containing protein